MIITCQISWIECVWLSSAKAKRGRAVVCFHCNDADNPAIIVWIICRVHGRADSVNRWTLVENLWICLRWNPVGARIYLHGSEFILTLNGRNWIRIFNNERSFCTCINWFEEITFNPLPITFYTLRYNSQFPEWYFSLLVSVVAKLQRLIKLIFGKSLPNSAFDTQRDEEVEKTSSFKCAWNKLINNRKTNKYVILSNAMFSYLDRTYRAPVGYLCCLPGK